MTGIGLSPAEMQALQQRQAQLNRAKKPEYMPPAILKQSKESQLYIFNVGPKRLEGNGASYGSMQIPACPAGAEYSEPLAVAGLPHEYYNLEGNRLSAQFHGEGDIEDPGWDFATQIIGGYTNAFGQFEGKMLNRSNSLERFGVGISRTWPPAKADVALARKKMLAEYSLLVQQAREAHAVGKLSSVITDDHYIAAAALGLTVETGERWLEFSAPAKQETKELCPKCRKAYEARTVEHECGFILDMVMYNKWVAEGRIAGVSAPAPPAPRFPGK